MLLEREMRILHLPGMPFSRARKAYRGERKSDRGDTRATTDQGDMQESVMLTAGGLALR